MRSGCRGWDWGGVGRVRAGVLGGWRGAWFLLSVSLREIVDSLESMHK